MGYIQTDPMAHLEKSFGWRKLARAYWFLLGEYRWKWLIWMLILFVVHLYVLVPPLILGKTVDFLTFHKAGDSLYDFYFYTGLLGISFVVFSFIRLSIKNIIGNLQTEVVYQTKVKGFEKLLDFSLAWHLEDTAGTKAQVIKTGVEVYTAMNSQLNSEIMRSLVAIFGVMAVFIFLRPPYVLFFVLYNLVFWVLLLSFRKKIDKENDSYFASIETAGGSYVEGLSNILTIKTLGAGAGFKKHIASKELVTQDHDLVIRKIYNDLWKCFHVVNGIGYGAFLFIVGRDVLAQQITPGALVIFYGYLQDLIGRSADMIDTYKIVFNSKAGIGRLMKIFWAKASVLAGHKKLPRNWDEIKLDKVNFVYSSSTKEVPADTRPKTLTNLSLDVPRYSKVGVVGRTGSGKSTLAKVLAGLYPISSGAYTIGSTSFYDLTHDEQTKQLTLVLQETEVFNLSLRENITLMRDIEPDVLEKALTIAQLNDVVAKLPNGLDNLVGEKGYHLSGGERQRVGIARAICKNSPIMIFDEATSSLDSKTELLIQEALETKLKDKTLIIIAHRVSTLQKADVIYVFDEGVIVEKGSFTELSQNKGSKFSELYKVQQMQVK
ncbi:ABC transporter ATP-binding protein [Candidatus Uhrbacteria bacterium]|nr:ABC transporter ATP-binding protein [Candidatus Uhrbacteria bacterium]